MRKLKIDFSPRNILSIIIAILFFIMVFTFIYNLSGNISGRTEDLINVAMITMDNFSPVFLLMSILLLTSMIGAFYLASKEEKR